MSTQYPRIYLAIDNCFAAKRWTTPRRWLKMAQKIGINFVEASADNECDPLYMDQEYLDDWVRDTKEWEKETGVKVINLYSGHGTYATLGLAHHDERIRNKIQHDWLGKMVKMAGSLEAGLGFFCHAFNQSLLQNPDEYSKACEELYSRLADLTDMGENAGAKTLGVEQMYTPHQIPWTIKGAKELLEKVYSISGRPFYITIDTGHQSGQRKFLKPTYGQIKESLRIYRKEGRIDGFWIGPRSAHMMFKKLSGDEKSDISVESIMEEIEKYPHLFADYEDGDPYEWLEKLGCYSPIIHLQQTPGDKSAHLPFTEENNKEGIINGEDVLRAIARSYENRDSDKMPPTCSEIYLTLEVFAGTAELPVDIINKLKDSVSYWRRFIPEDGLNLDSYL
ncbi:MAG: TIM barrel protein [Planctomycetota bacterium]|jgi:sugar phosphate isomerase/epimerase